MLFFIALQASLIMVASGFNLIMQIPSMGFVVERNETFTIVCLSDLPIQRCEIKNFWRNDLYIMNEDTEISTEKHIYSGKYLFKGECSVTINGTGKFVTYRVFTCRARTVSSGWQYDTGMVHIDSKLDPEDGEVEKKPPDEDAGDEDGEDDGGDDGGEDGGGDGKDDGEDNTAQDPAGESGGEDTEYEEDDEQDESEQDDEQDESEEDDNEEGRRRVHIGGDKVSGVARDERVNDDDEDLDLGHGSESKDKLAESYEKLPQKPVTTGPLTVYVDQGGSVDIMYETVLPITYCVFTVPNDNRWLASGGDHFYTVIDGGKEKGRCGLKLFNLTSENSGFLEADVRTEKGGFMQITTIIVKTPPNPPVLTLNNNDGFYNNGDYLQASCFLSPARPIGRIEWLLGNDVIRNDHRDDSDLGADYTHEFSARCITQKINLKLTKSDNGKELICRGEHIAWPGGRIETRKRIFISVSSSKNSDILLLLTWFLIGVAAVTLGVAVVVAFLIGTTYLTQTWCFEISGR